MSSPRGKDVPPGGHDPKVAVFVPTDLSEPGIHPDLPSGYLSRIT
ncbi:MAG TPA: hypothetical protein VL069_06070 [Opitutus sp.]|nr:hypothetical protein [Opitutus sp.]